MDRDKDFLRSEFSWGVILRADLETIEEAKRSLAELDARVVYQTISADRLYIVKEKEGRRRHE